MSIVQCPNCGLAVTGISPQTPNCPRCGFPIGLYPLHQQRNPYMYPAGASNIPATQQVATFDIQQKHKKHRKWIWVALIAFALIILCYVSYLLYCAAGVRALQTVIDVQADSFVENNAKALFGENDEPITIPNPQEISLGETIKTDKWIFTLTSVEWMDSYHVLDRRTGQEGTHSLWADGGKDYYVVRGQFTNLQTSPYNLVDKTNIDLLVNGAYPYSGHAISFDLDFHNLYNVDSIAPLETVELYLTVLLPQGMQNTMDSSVLTWTFLEANEDSDDAVEAYRIKLK